jgi:hypothetical protein
MSSSFTRHLARAMPMSLPRAMSLSTSVHVPCWPQNKMQQPTRHTAQGHTGWTHARGIKEGGARG